MRELDFYRLSRSVQERFVASVIGAGAPSALLKQQTLPLESLLWTGVSGVGALAVLALWALGFGNLDSSLAMHSLPMVAVYVLFVAVCAFGALRALSLTRELRRLPFRPGRYLFPAGLIEARGSRLAVAPIHELSAIDGPDANKRVHLVFSSGRAYAFELAGKDAAAALRSAVQNAKAAVMAAEASGNRSELLPLDPLQDPGFSSPFSPKTPMIKAAPLWAKYAIAWAVLAGLAIGPVLFLLRNRYSDARLLRAAERVNTSAGYRSYLDHGGTDPEVIQTLLPRAELVDASKEHSVDAIRKFIKTHPQSRIESEVSAAMRVALLVEVEKAAAAGTVTALQELKQRFPEHPLVAPEIAQALHAVYAAAFKHYKDVCPDRNKGVLAFMERLLAYCEKNGPRVDLRFHRKTSPSIERADAQVKKSPFYVGPPSLPSRYFDDEHISGWEGEIAKALFDRFATAFPKDVLSLQRGAPVGESDPLPAVTVPTMFIEYTLQMSGASYISAKPRGVYVGLGLTAEPTFRIPGDPKALPFKVSAWRPPDLNPKKMEPPFEQNVYEAMGDAAFSKFSKDYQNLFFEPPETKPAP
jgi:hypothetical protein